MRGLPAPVCLWGKVLALCFTFSCPPWGGQAGAQPGPSGFRWPNWKDIDLVAEVTLDSVWTETVPRQNLAPMVQTVARASVHEVLFGSWSGSDLVFHKAYGSHGDHTYRLSHDDVYLYPNERCIVMLQDVPDKGVWAIGSNRKLTVLPDGSLALIGAQGQSACFPLHLEDEAKTESRLSREQLDSEIAEHLAPRAYARMAHGASFVVLAVVDEVERVVVGADGRNQIQHNPTERSLVMSHGKQRGDSFYRVRFKALRDVKGRLPERDFVLSLPDMFSPLNRSMPSARRAAPFLSTGERVVLLLEETANGLALAGDPLAALYPFDEIHNVVSRLRLTLEELERERR